MKKRTNRFRYFMQMILLAALCPLAAQEIGSSNYLYTNFQSVVGAPPAYIHSRSITAKDYSEDSGLFELLQDVFVSDTAVYVLCKNKLITFHHDFTLDTVLTGYTADDGTVTPFDECSGLFVTKAGDYYISQAEFSRILHFNADHSLRRILNRPAIHGFENIAYRPGKLTGDGTGRLYVIAKGMYEGIVELNADGSFSRFYGVHSVRLNPAEIIWRSFSTKEQRKRQRLWLPADFSSLCMDSEGLVFATEQGQYSQITRLNAAGASVIKVDKDIYPCGDFSFNQFGQGIPVGPSQMIAIDTDNTGVYLALDMVRSRIFAYNEDHRMLFIFGGQGDRAGYFGNPIDVAFVGKNIVVLDSLAQSLELFEPTLYGKAINDALSFQRAYRYDEAMEAWRTALKYDHNFTLAYAGMGRCLLRQKKYTEALEYLRLGYDREYYSKAFEKVRNQKLRASLPAVLWCVILFALLRLILFAARKTGITAAIAGSASFAPIKAGYNALSARLKEPFAVFWYFPWRIMGSPFKGFDEMKYEKKGNYAFAFFIFGLSALVNIMASTYNGFIINFNNPYKLNSILLASQVLFPILLFITSNWSITTLLDGKGKYGEIFLTVMYALFPVCLLRLISILLSNVLTMEEMPISTALLSIAAVAFVLYLFIGLAVIHQYSFTKCLVSLLLTVVAMGIITFILMLIFSLGSEVVQFVVTVARELSLKYF